MKNRKSSFTCFILQFHDYLLWRNHKAVAGHILGKWSSRNPSLKQQRLLHKDNSTAYTTLERSEKPWQGFHSIFNEQKDYTWDHFFQYQSLFFWFSNNQSRSCGILGSMSSLTTGHIFMCFQTSEWFSAEALDENSLPMVQFPTDVLRRHEEAFYTISLLKFPIQK